MEKAVSFVIRLLSVPLFLSMLMFFAAIMEGHPEKIIPWEEEETVDDPAAKVVIYGLLIENAGKCATVEYEGREVARHCYDNPLIELRHPVREEMMISTKRNEDRSLWVRAKFDYYKIVRQGFRRLAQHFNSLQGGMKMDIDDVRAFLDERPSVVSGAKGREEALRIAQKVLRVKARSDAWKAERIFPRCVASRFVAFLAKRRVAEFFRPCG